MASFCRYGTSDLAEMYPIWNFHLSLAHLCCLIFCWIDNGGALVAQSLMVTLLKNQIQPPYSNLIELLGMQLALIGNFGLD